MRLLAPLALAACTAAAADPKPAAKPAPAPPPAPAATELHPLKMEGPFKSAYEACTHAPPCGFTDMDERGDMTKPAKHPDCGAIKDPTFDLLHPANARELISTPKFGGTVQLGSVRCAVPRGLRYEHGVYYLFVMTSSGTWWRTEPLYRADYNEKYCAVTATTRWNHRDARTYLGLALTSQCPSCNRQAEEDETLEYMVRIEPGTDEAGPRVYAPLLVGEKLVQKPNDDIDPSEKPECKAVNQHISLDEKWSGDDDLTLAGAAQWYALFVEDGLVNVGLNSSKKVPSTAGTYKFTR
jgi:hypothetical protein